MFPLLMVFNPPYDERITINDPDFLQKIGDTFKQNIEYFGLDDFIRFRRRENVGLRPSRKNKNLNGKLECRFLQYEMYEGTKFINWKSKNFNRKRDKRNV